MKTRLLKRLRKKVEKKYIIVSSYPKFEIRFKCMGRSDRYFYLRSYSKLTDALATLRVLRNDEIKSLIKKIRDKQRDKNLRKL